jgi:hypothetical protein
MIHIFDLGKKIEKSLIFGKGPSFDPITMAQVRMCGDTFVIAINQTATELLKIGYMPDLVVANDIEPLVDINNLNIRYAIPVHPHFNKKPTLNTYEDMLLNYSEVFRFDLWTAHIQLFPQHPIFCVPSSYITALLIAVHFGAKTVFTNGIDGGNTRHDVFKRTKQIHPPNYDVQFKDESKIMIENGLKIIRVRNLWAKMEEVIPSPIK